MNCTSKYYRVVHRIASVLFPFVFKFKIEHPENLPMEGPLIVCCNHTSLFDAIAVAVAVKNAQIYFLGKQELFEKNSLIGFLARKFEAIPVKRHEVDLTAVRSCNKILKEGKILGIFPEGTRIKTGEIAKGEPGTAMFALRNKVPILPMRIRGRYGFRKCVTLVVGKPFELTDFYETRMNASVLEEATESIMEHIKEL